MTPSIGRIVHYVSYGTPGGEFQKACRAAIITAVHSNDEVSGEPIEDELVALAVLNPTGMFFQELCPHDEKKNEVNNNWAGGSWHWPERK